MNKRNTLFIALGLISLTCICQVITISGRVVDASTEKPLSFSTVSILGTSEGVVSNFLGEFEFKMQNSGDSDTLHVSMLGYKPFIAPVHALRNNRDVVIKLNEHIVFLEEIEVNEKALNASEIVNKVIENIPVNYPVTPYLLDGFTRSHKHECGKYVTLYEAVFSVYGQGYHKKVPERIYINQSRQSQHVPYYHSRVLRNNRNLFISMGHINDVLFRSHSLKTNHNSYEIDSYTFIEHQLVYVIKTNHSKHAQHTMYINAEDYALLKVRMEMKTSEDEDWNPHLNRGPSSDSLDFKVTQIAKTVQFEKNGNRYHSKYMDWLVEGVLYDKESEEEFCDWGFRFETMFDKVATENVEKPSKEALLNPRSKKDPPSTPYDAMFWKSYPLITEFPITPEIVADLEVNGPLERQFEQSSSEL